MAPRLPFGLPRLVGLDRGDAIMSAVAAEPVFITAHAIQRWCERVNPRASMAEAIAAIHQADKGIRAAAAFGATVVRHPRGCRLVLAQGEARVVTVLARGKINHSDRRYFDEQSLPASVW